MHEYSTRAMQHRRQLRALHRSVLAAGLVLGLASPALPAAIEETTPMAGSYGLSFQNAPHEIAVSLVQPGEEGLQLSARLDEQSGMINRDIHWQVLSSDGQIMSDLNNPLASLSLTPGAYTVRATYGSANFETPVEIKPGNQLSISFIFNIGAVRVLATVDGLDRAEAARNFIYSNTGRDRGKLVTISNNPGEVLRLPAGAYRIESRIEPGNVTSVTDVTIRPGILTAIEISHKAGVAHFAYSGSATGEVHWQILSDTGVLLAGLEGPTGTATLMPGTYRAEAQVAGQTMSETFAVAAGQQETIELGN